MAIYSGFTHLKWWFSIVMLVYHRVPNDFPNRAADIWVSFGCRSAARHTFASSTPWSLAPSSLVVLLPSNLRGGPGEIPSVGSGWFPAFTCSIFLGGLALFAYLHTYCIYKHTHTELQYIPQLSIILYIIYIMVFCFFFALQISMAWCINMFWMGQASCITCSMLSYPMTWSRHRSCTLRKHQLVVDYS